MANALSGMSYLNQDYGTEENPASAPKVEGGWGGALVAGVSALAGLATDNPYLVGFGSDMASSYAESYDTLNKSLMEEQRANRLANAALDREKHLAQYEYDMREPERESEERWKQKEYALRQSQEARLAEQAKLQGQLTQAQIDEMNKSPEQKAREQVAQAKIVAQAQRQINLDNTAAQNAQQLNHLEDSLIKAGASEEQIKRAKLTLMLQQAGLDVKAGEKAKPFSGEQKVKLQQTAKEEYMNRPENQARLETEPAKVEAEADKHGIMTANAIEASLRQGGGGVSLVDQLLGGSGGGDGGDTSGQSDLQRAIRMYYRGDVTASQLMAGADTPEEKAAVQEAINRVQRENYAPGSAAAVEERLGAQVAAEQQGALQQQYEQAPTPLAQQAVVNQAQAQGVQIDTGQTAKFDERQERTINRYVDRYQNADAKEKQRIIANLRKNAPQALLDEVLRRIQ